jgi:hypothetical protein
MRKGQNKLFKHMEETKKQISRTMKNKFKCNPESFKIVRLAKQNELMEYLDSIDLKGSYTDIIIDNGICGKERPDRVYDFNDKIIF